jgi:hypothetical protein
VQRTRNATSKEKRGSVAEISVDYPQSDGSAARVMGAVP